MKPRPRPPCAHCGLNIGRNRRLCSACWHNRDIREQYPLTRPTRFRGEVCDFYGTGKQAQSTLALPSTLEKILVMAERADRGEEIFAAGDARRDMK